MLKKIFRVFIRDLKSTKREPIAVFIVIMPVIVGIAI